MVERVISNARTTKDLEEAEVKCGMKSVKRVRKSLLVGEAGDTMQVLVFAQTYFIYVHKQLTETVDLGINKATDHPRGTIGTFEGWRVNADGSKFPGECSTPSIFPQGFLQKIFDADSEMEILVEVRC